MDACPNELVQFVASLLDSLRSPLLALRHSKLTRRFAPRLIRSPPTPLRQFVSGFLGLSVFDACDIWAATGTGGVGQMFSMSCETAPTGFEVFRTLNATGTAEKWEGAIGRCYATGDPVWEIGEGEFDKSR